jgi:acetyl esterase/lipase
MRQRSWYHATIVMPVLILLMVTSVSRAAEEKAADAIDWNRARQLRQRSQSGATLTAEEQAYLKRAEKAWPTRGGTGSAKSRSVAAKPRGSSAEVDATKITQPVMSVEVCPVEVFSTLTSDGQKVTFPLRKPPGKGPFPALIHLHGGLGTLPLATLKQELLDVQTHCRFLAAGYVVVNPTFRSREKDPQTRDALVDCLAVIDYVKKMPAVDPKSVVLWGDSGGGSLVLELAGETPLCAVTAQEPATVLFTGMLSLPNLPKPDRKSVV